MLPSRPEPHKAVVSAPSLRSEMSKSTDGHGGPGRSPLEALVERLQLDVVAEDVFGGSSGDDGDDERVFGGLLAARALVSAGTTVEAGRRAHALHAWFLRPGHSSTPITYSVGHISEGRSFSRREVVATQGQRALARVVASFVVGGNGPDRQVSSPDAPRPETLPSLTTATRRRPALDVRRASPPVGAHVEELSSQKLWIRADGELPDDPLVHAAVLTYASDVGLLHCVRSVHGDPSSSSGPSAVTVDHTIFFHRPFRADHWLLYDQQGVSTHGVLGVAAGRWFSRDGAHVASVTQEALLQPNH